MLQINLNGWRTRRVSQDNLVHRSGTQVVVLLETKLHALIKAPVPQRLVATSEGSRYSHRVANYPRRFRCISRWLGNTRCLPATVFLPSDESFEMWEPIGFVDCAYGTLIVELEVDGT